ncbi:Crp/Fnr family transcriptional regulator [Pseudoxanthomonas dokdonensis]|uniref:Crp/Fnr family transcriptional regulator n=2 Tax=Pseudoxanthomonas dokdonensis TaxID=344882 RepID=A0A0R0CRH7_9GAMM|nr:Crp/Fnr family transcriptional regulator [Pseudoxanthomonas dokdonensis]
MWLALCGAAVAGCQHQPAASAAPAHAGSDATAIASAQSPRILVFSRTRGWRHDSIPTAIATLRLLATQQGLQMDASEDPGLFTPQSLARYRAVVFASTTRDVLDDAQQAALQAFIRDGGGFMGIHAAADTEYDWPWYGELVGAWFANHPPDGLRSSQVTFADAGMTDDGQPWPVTDEFYNYKRNPRGQPQLQVIATLDESRYEGGRMGADHPIAWCRPWQGGRSWYTGLGHDAALYADPVFRRHLARGLAFATGSSSRC